MAYHITVFQNNSTKQCATTNPAANRDNYVLNPGAPVRPGNPPLINKPGNLSTKTYAETLVWANFIYTAAGPMDYTFWDSEQSQIFGITQQNPGGPPQLLYSGSAGNLQLTINADGTISFQRA